VPDQSVLVVLALVGVYIGMKAFTPRGEEVRGGQRNMRSEELHNELYLCIMAYVEQ